MLQTDRSTLRRKFHRGAHDRATIDAILDQALFCHVGFDYDGAPIVIPTIHARNGDVLYIHGSAAGRTMRSLGVGIAVCVTVTILDGIVVARSRFHCSMNYRSVMLFGTPRRVDSDNERALALDAIVEHVIPSRVRETRTHTRTELRQTAVLALPIREGSAKIRTGGPLDDPEDLRLPVWAGVVPLNLTAGAPQPAHDLIDPIMECSPSVRALVDTISPRAPHRRVRKDAHLRSRRQWHPSLRVIPLLLAQGDTVAAMTRTPNKASLLEKLGAIPVVCDVFDRNTLCKSVVSFDPAAVFHLLTNLPDHPSEMATFAAGHLRTLRRNRQSRRSRRGVWRTQAARTERRVADPFTRRRGLSTPRRRRSRTPRQRRAVREVVRPRHVGRRPAPHGTTSPTSIRPPGAPSNSSTWHRGLTPSSTTDHDQPLD